MFKLGPEVCFYAGIKVLNLISSRLRKVKHLY